MSEIVQYKNQAPIQEIAYRLSAVDVRQHVNMVQEVMQAVMKPEVHYGKIPGSLKPTLYKAGAEVLCMTFRINDVYEITDLSVNGSIRYRVRCIGKHQVTEKCLGEGMGEASSDEEKYKWRSAVCAEEFEEAIDKRKKYGKKKGGGFYVSMQVRTEAADIANTVLKMACKRAKIAMTLNVTAASDMFTQDIEDLPEELRETEGMTEPQTDPELTKKWIDQANSAKTQVELSSTWQDGVKAFRAANDIDGASEFKKAVQAKGAELKKPPPQEPVTDADDWTTEGES